MRLTAYNPSTDNLEKTYLSQAYAAGVSQVIVKNSDNIAANDRILIGEMGREKSEIVTVTSVASDKITVNLTSATKFPHSADDPVYVLRYDSIRFYRSTTGVDGTYNFLTVVPVDVDNAQKETYYNDNNGLSSYYYEISFYHSVAAIESALSDPMPGEGYSRSQVGSIIQDFLEEVDDLEQNYVTVPKIFSWFNEVNDDLSSQSRKPYRFLRESWTLSTTAANNRIPLPAGLKFFDFLEYNYGTDTYLPPEVEVISLQEILDFISTDSLASIDDDTLRYVAIDETTNELVLYPTPYTTQSNVITIYGWTSFTAITDLSDKIQTPTPRIYKLFLLARFWRKRAIKESAFRAMANDFMQEYNTEIVKLQRANRVDIGSLRAMKPDRPQAYFGTTYGNKYR